MKIKGANKFFNGGKSKSRIHVTNKRSITKAFTWRIIATISTVVLVYILQVNLKLQLELE